MGTESLTRAVNSKDLEMERHVTDVDHVAAMASGNRLGSLLFRFSAGAQPAWGRAIVLILAKRMARRYKFGRTLAERIAACALIEFTQPQCVVCRGAREYVDEELKLKVTCVACNGSGKERHDDDARRARIGVYGARVDAAMAACHSAMSIAVGDFLRATASRMGE